jgi:lon-related putative ATP-dependent protease
MKKINALNYKHLRKKLDPHELDFKTTDELTAVTEFVGQKRALNALNFGIDVKSHGYNLYAMGPSGIGKRSLVRMVLAAHASKQPVPPDWCYVYNFVDPEKPIAINLPKGMGGTLNQDMKLVMDELGANIMTIFESAEYHLEMKRIANSYRAKFKTSEMKLITTNKTNVYKEQYQKEKALQTILIKSVARPAFIKLKKKYKKFPSVINYLTAVERDIIENGSELVKPDEKTNLLTFSMENPALTKYKVNVLVDNSKLKGAPIIFEESPSYYSLICRVEYAAHMGALTTNFTLIKSGSLHLANGGYLIIEARKLKKNKEAWEALKSALYSRRIKIKPIEHESDSIKTVSIEPMPIPLHTKIILLGDRNTYYSLCQHDPDFRELFKVPVDFDEQIPRNKKNIELYARLLATISRREGLRPFDASAVAEIIDYSSRLAEDIEKLTTHIRDIEDILIESDYWAGTRKKNKIESIDVKHAISAQVERMNRSKELYYEDIERDFIIIKTKGKLIGQVNCLSVRKVGNFSYGHPTRVTARVRMGKGKLIDIQREIELAGPMHSKAGLIIANFLASRFTTENPFSLHASLSFEQIYCWTDGDSASVGELCALLSALAEVPIYQFLAITGSIDQNGMVQAIGGVNEKIEGFFDICQARGLTGNQGVIIPKVNMQNLMLREDILKAAKSKKFFIYPIETIDEAITLLTGMPAGKKDKSGKFTKDSIYERIFERLQKLNNKAKSYKDLE